MTSKAKAIQTLYRANRITKEGVHQAVEKGVITAEEYYIITGEYFEEPAIPEIEPETEIKIAPEEVPNTGENIE